MMAITKRNQKQLERQLIATLTEACEEAKAELRGFQWLTHDNGDQAFPAGLRITWIFDTEANLSRALGKGEDQRMRTLTKAALEEANMDPKSFPDCLQFDSEEACQNAQNGDWIARLTQLRRRRH